MNYYNENDSDAAAWLRALIAAGLIPGGDVDERSIIEVEPDDLGGYDQCHFFAGIGGWCRALQLAGVPDDVRLWTGSCPCQPLSSAGKRAGEMDERHLWPAFANLIAECKPPVVLGEQVASSDGREWLAGVFLDLEELGYAVAGADLPAASVAAPHRRSRLFWVADSEGECCSSKRDETAKGRGEGELGGSCRGSSGVGDTNCEGLQERVGDGRIQPAAGGTQQGKTVELRGDGGFWGDNIEVFADGKARRIKPGLELLVDGVPGRVAQLRGLGNAIVPQIAAEFIKAALMDVDLDC